MLLLQLLLLPSDVLASLQRAVTAAAAAAVAYRVAAHKRWPRPDRLSEAVPVAADGNGYHPLPLQLRLRLRLPLRLPLRLRLRLPLRMRLPLRLRLRRLLQLRFDIKASIPKCY